MDADRFDAVVRSLSIATARRAILPAVLGLGISALLSRIGSEDAEAKKKRRNKRRKKKKKKNEEPCPAGTKLCGSSCIPIAECCGGCPAGQQCRGGACISLVDCGGGCPAGQQCCAGVCIPTKECCGGCSGGLTCCNGTCVDLAEDGTNCGECGRVCEFGGCVHGACICRGLQDCPFPCYCGQRLQGGGACFLGAPGPPCDNDDDCPIGSVCITNGFCSLPCLA